MLGKRPLRQSGAQSRGHVIDDYTPGQPLILKEICAGNRPSSQPRRHYEHRPHLILVRTSPLPCAPMSYKTPRAKVRR